MRTLFIIFALAMSTQAFSSEDLLNGSVEKELESLDIPASGPFHRIGYNQDGSTKGVIEFYCDGMYLKNYPMDVSYVQLIPAYMSCDIFSQVNGVKREVLESAEGLGQRLAHEKIAQEKNPEAYSFNWSYVFGGERSLSDELQSYNHSTNSLPITSME